MSESPLESGQLHSDEEWKAHVKAEDAKRDEQLQSGDEPDAGDLPPASFESLIRLLAAQAMTALGLIPGPDGQPAQHLPVGRHFVDLLGVLEAKTKGQLTPDEQHLMDEVLHELRMAYVAVSRNS